jgi:hypothetical protein
MSAGAKENPGCGTGAGEVDHENCQYLYNTPNLFESQAISVKTIPAGQDRGPAGGGPVVAALDYVARGWEVFPVWWIKKSRCACGEADWQHPGKHPLGKLAPNGRNDATTDPKIIKGWWKRYPSANVGIATGSESGLVVVDIDPRNSGNESKKKLERLGNFSYTITVHTGGGGEHIYLQHPGHGQKIKSKSELGGFPGIDQKGDGGYIVAPPSNHISGDKYTWKIPPDTPLAKIPDWLMQLLTKDSEPLRGTVALTGEKIPDGKRNGTLTSLAGTMRRRGMSQEAIEAALLVENKRCDPPLSEKDVLTVARSVSRYAPGTDSAPQWTTLAPQALHGLAGEFVRLVEPHTESDPTALLLQFLIGSGNLIGKGAYAKVEADTHCCNLFAVAVGETAKGRKGTSWGQVKAPLTAVDPEWRNRVKSGLSSGEGLIFQVRDQVIKRVAKQVRGQTVYEDEITDFGEDDKRLLVVESEFANVLRQIERQGNILSAVSRDAWDTGDLGTLTKNSPTKATGAHVSIIGHITKGELKRYLTRTEAGNGFGNRILWFCVERSKVLPEGGRIHEVDFAPFLKRLGEAILFAQCAGEVTRDAEARSLWAKVYPDLSEGKPGMVGALTSRAEAQVLRLSMIYALLDGEKLVRAPHLLAALAVWDYCEISVRYIFGQTLGDPVADCILEALQAAQDGLTRTEIYNLFGRHQRSENIQQAIGELLRRSFIAVETIETGGRPTEKLKYMGAHKAH